MKKILFTSLLVSLCPCVASAQNAKPDAAVETEVEWKVIASAKDRNIDQVLTQFINHAATGIDVSNEEKAELKRLKDLLAKEPVKITEKDLLGLKKVRSIQVSLLGVFKYSYFNCRFKQAGTSLFFEKTMGSQKKSGLLFQHNPTSFVFLGAATVNDEAQRKYSGLTGSKNTEYDAAGLFVKRGKTVLALFAKSGQRFEIYEFK